MDRDPLNGANLNSSAAALLSGATGFLGAHLLRDLLTQTSLPVFCLVRASDDADGRARLQRSLASRGLWSPDFAPRIRVVRGDLACTNLGLSNAMFRSVAEQVSVVYHCGAQVNLVFPYRALHAANVAGTAEMLRLSSLHPPKHFHHISSVKVLDGGGNSEAFQVPAIPPGTSGYAHSKWAAERLVNQAAEHGLTASIYRVGRITGHSETGYCHEADALSMMIKACIRLAAAPELNGHIHLTPVDFVSRAIIDLSRRSDTSGKAFHLMSRPAITWQQVVGIMADAGYLSQSLPFDKWQARLGKIGDIDSESLAALLAMGPPFSSRERTIADENTLAALATPALLSSTDHVLLLQRQLRFLSSEGRTHKAFH